MQIFLHETEVCGGDSGTVTEAWVHQIRDIMLDSKDAINVFDASLVRSSCILGNLRAQIKVGARIRRIRN
jgi:disease resistance protein RPM1